MIQFIKKEDCVGCGACIDVCPRKCIEWETEPSGFRYPRVDESQCIKCNRCVSVCPSIHPARGSLASDREVYACWNKNEKNRIESTSGGVFSALASRIMEMGGYVCGAEYDDDFCVRHAIYNRPEDIPRLRQSKYMQSRTDSVYNKIKEVVEKGVPVLFCGTPCQNAALRKFIPNDPPNLYQCDFICRGVISPKVFSKYKEWLVNKYGSPVKKVHFKNKTYGWNRFSTKITFENEKAYIADRYKDPYMQCYLTHNVSMRLSCHHCKYKGLTRYADITLGDFWGVSNVSPELDSDKGTSVAMLNTEKGARLFHDISDALTSRQCDVKDVEPGNLCLMQCVPEGKNRERFLNDLDRYAFDKLYKKYCTEAFGKRFIKCGMRLFKYLRKRTWFKRKP